MLLVNCSSCHASYEVDDEVEGMLIRYRECGERGRVPSLQPEEPPKVEATAPTPRFYNCRICDKPYPLAAHMKKCPACGGRLATPAARRESARGLTPQLAAERTSSGPRFRVSVLLWVAGLALLVAAFFVNQNIDERDFRQVKIDNSLYDFTVKLSQLNGSPLPDKYRQGPKGDRAPVYLLVGLGVLCLALGCVCWAVEGTANPQTSSPPPS
jgi:hypothetical protein